MSQDISNVGIQMLCGNHNLEQHVYYNLDGLSVNTSY